MVSLSATNDCLRDQKPSDRNFLRRVRSAQISYSAMNFLSDERLNTYSRQYIQYQLRKGDFSESTYDIHGRHEMLLDISLKVYRSDDSLRTSHHQPTPMFILGRSLVSEAKKVIRVNVSAHSLHASRTKVEITQK